MLNQKSRVADFENEQIVTIKNNIHKWYLLCSPNHSTNK